MKVGDVTGMGSKETLISIMVYAFVIHSDLYLLAWKMDVLT
jgi:hypothetical protein